jgi:transcriptional regulator with XRE-family HTH domain
MTIPEEKISAIYDRIKSLCKNKGISQIELCNACEMNLHSHKGRITRNIAPDVFDALKMAQYLGTSVEYLITGEEKDIYKEKYETLKKNLELTLQREL